MSHSHEDPDADRRALQVRLRKITGQLLSLEKRVAGDYDCAEVLNQLLSARKAIKSLAEKIILEHLEHCLEDMAPDTKGPQKLKEVETMLRRYVE